MMRYVDVFDLEAVSYTLDQLLGLLDEAAIGRAVMQAEWSQGDYREENDQVAQIVRAHEDRFVGFASVNAADGMKAITELRRSVETLGLRGLNVQPFASNLYANDKKFYPLYLKCLEYGIPVTIHTGINYSNDRTIDFGRPIYVDEVACDFPGLKIVLNHGGWPWVNESVAIARKHKSVFIEIGGIAPKYIAAENAGWDMLLRFANNLLQDQILFATDSMVPFKRAVTEAKALPLKPEVLAKLMGGNAEKLLQAT
ncbi:MAG: amidohydrolase [Proteobacteria bacterium]|nr:amidohydrolase [Pseudomonadota bacterium]